MTDWSVETLLQYLRNSDYKIEGKIARSIGDVASIQNGTTNDISFCAFDDYRGILSISRSNAGVILCKKTRGLVYPNKKYAQVLIFVHNPRLEFTRIAKKN
ncbi:MAG: hypothetical protein L0H53_05135 [Candidatus Nitrosocosmicus sp.]|nr:hypothetical protein [Candidatus Nitrosocosmicus sp.]MDN5866703.1 hypothetical protein [Candidatus Nitrosocosmicus sp.]